MDRATPEQLGIHVTLRKVQYAAFASEETSCFTAIVLVDGKDFCIASNEGHGGPDDYRPLPKETYDQHRAKMKALEERLETLPKRPRWEGDEPHTLSFESLVGHALNDHLHEKDKKRLANSTKKQLSKRVMWQMPDGSLREFKVNAKDDAQFQRMKVEAKTKYPTARLLNDMPFDEAFSLLVQFK